MNPVAIVLVVGSWLVIEAVIHGWVGIAAKRAAERRALDALLAEIRRQRAGVETQLHAQRHEREA
jgi:hypothetical protein